MVVSVHLADVGWRAAPGVIRRKPEPGKVPGLRYAVTTTTAPLGSELLPSPQPGRVGMIASWDDDAALERFRAEDPLARRFANGWMAKLEPLRVYGAWSGMPDLPTAELPAGEDERVAVLTLGQLRLRRIGPFLRASAHAEGEALGETAMIASIGLARPPRMVATFSVWRNVAAMRDYVAKREGGAHPAAVHSHLEDPFHHESAFIRFRPYASSGSWDGRDPLAL
ncbi:MAG TPA: hypothetical protein VG518_03750 [Solirubrobacterales bacterium]|nr:hypothetical protein [Solirubrobacterales bacterium]